MTEMLVFSWFAGLAFTLPLACAYGVPMSQLGAVFRLRLRELMERHHVTQQALADALAVDRARVSRILRSDDEAGTVKIDRLEALAKFFKMPVAELMRAPGEAPVELKPLESQLIELYRRLPTLQQENLFLWLDFVFAERISVERGRKQLQILRRSVAKEIEGQPRRRR